MPPSYSHRMNELEQFWAAKLAEAAENARASGRHDVADYLALRAANDALRRTAVTWLFDSLIEIAAEASRGSLAVSIEREDPHAFSLRGANLTGSLIRLRQGVRCMSIEAGWTRTPADGFLRGGALAIARLDHFGIARANEELMLMANGGSPFWAVSDDLKAAGRFDTARLRMHFRIFRGS